MTIRKAKNQDCSDCSHFMAHVLHCSIIHHNHKSHNYMKNVSKGGAWLIKPHTARKKALLNLLNQEIKDN